MRMIRGWLDNRGGDRVKTWQQDLDQKGKNKTTAKTTCGARQQDQKHQLVHFTLLEVTDAGNMDKSLTRSTVNFKEFPAWAVVPKPSWPICWHTRSV